MGPLITVKVFGDYWWSFGLSGYKSSQQTDNPQEDVCEASTLTHRHCYPPSRSCGTRADLRSEVSQSNRRAGRSYVSQGPHSRRQGRLSYPLKLSLLQSKTFINKRVNVTEASPRSGSAQGARFIISPRLSERNVWFVSDQRWQPACLRIINHQQSVR